VEQNKTINRNDWNKRKEQTIQKITKKKKASLGCGAFLRICDNCINFAKKYCFD
jgi:hypothetical protein